MAVEKFGASERLACKILGQNRSAFRKKKPDMGLAEAELRAALRAVAVTHPAWGVAQSPLAPARPAGLGRRGTERQACAPALAAGGPDL